MHQSDGSVGSDRSGPGKAVQGGIFRGLMCGDRPYISTDLYSATARAYKVDKDLIIEGVRETMGREF